MNLIRNLSQERSLLSSYRLTLHRRNLVPIIVLGFAALFKQWAVYTAFVSCGLLVYLRRVAEEALLHRHYVENEDCVHAIASRKENVCGYEELTPPVGPLPNVVLLETRNSSLSLNEDLATNAQDQHWNSLHYI